GVTDFFRGSESSRPRSFCGRCYPTEPGSFGDRLCSSGSRANSAFPFRAPDSALVHTEVVRDFVPDRIRDDLLQMFHAARHALVRTLINRDLIRHAERIADAAAGQRAAMIQA